MAMPSMLRNPVRVDVSGGGPYAQGGACAIGAALTLGWR